MLIASKLLKLAMHLNQFSPELADRLERLAVSKMQQFHSQEGDESPRRKTPTPLTKTTPDSLVHAPQHKKWREQTTEWANRLQGEIDEEYKSEFEDYDAIPEETKKEAPKLLSVNNLVALYDAIKGIEPFQTQLLTQGELTDEENVRFLQWQAILEREVNSIGNRIQELMSIMTSLGSDEGPYLNNYYCPGCGGNLLHPGESDYAIDEMTRAFRCNDCGEEFVGDAYCENCGSTNVIELDEIPDNLLYSEPESEDNYVCTSCSGEYTQDEINMYFPVSASALGPYTQQPLNPRYFLGRWSEQLPLPEKIQLTQEAITTIHDAGPFVTKWFGVSQRFCEDILKLLDHLSGYDLSKWEEPGYAQQRVRKPWER